MIPLIIILIIILINIMALKMILLNMTLLNTILLNTIYDTLENRCVEKSHTNTVSLKTNPHCIEKTVQICSGTIPQ